jgi:hypothetical protein
VKHWRTLKVGHWCVMVYQRPIETAWLVCCENTVILAADSLFLLMALGAWRAWRYLVRPRLLILDTIRRIGTPGRA